MRIDAMRSTGAGANITSKPTEPNFSELMQAAVGEINQLMGASETASVLLAQGEIDIHSAVIAAEKAGLALQLGVTVRNKIVEAYQEIMRMQI